MFHEPKTKEEAAKYRYGRWAGQPFGHGYDSAKCAAEVSDKWMSKQCAKKPGHGPDALYCSIHAKKLTTANVEGEGPPEAEGRREPASAACGRSLPPTGSASCGD